MKLLILTQKVDINDDVLGFMHDWIAEFAKHCKKVTVICLYKGTYNLPENVEVLSLGKENLKIKNLKLKIFKKLIYSFNFLKYIWQERKNYDSVFVHMNVEYVVLGGLFWRLWGKKIGLWYAHGYVPFSLRIAEKVVNIIFTSTKSGCRLNSNKIRVIGQGVDVEKFKNQNSKIKSKDDIFRVITVGRISPVKNYETLIKAAELLVIDNFKFKIDIIGGPGTPEQKKYLENLKKMVKDKNLWNIINFIDPVPNKNIINYLQSADLFVNASHTGSLDKAILEAMACGIIIISCNEALVEVLGEYKNILMFKKGDYKELAKKIKYFMELQSFAMGKISDDLREIVKKEHSIDKLIKKILSKYNLE